MRRTPHDFWAKKITCGVSEARPLARIDAACFFFRRPAGPGHAAGFFSQPGPGRWTPHVFFSQQAAWAMAPKRAPETEPKVTLKWSPSGEAGWAKTQWKQRVLAQNRLSGGPVFGQFWDPKWSHFGDISGPPARARRPGIWARIVAACFFSRPAGLQWPHVFFSQPRPAGGGRMYFFSQARPGPGGRMLFFSHPKNMRPWPYVFSRLQKSCIHGCMIFGGLRKNNMRPRNKEIMRPQALISDALAHWKVWDSSSF